MDRRAWLLAIAALLAAARAALAQDFPSKPIHIIVPFAAGSATDIAARLVGEKLNGAWGQPVLVENRPGAGGTIGIAQTAKSDADGYTLAVVSTGHVVNDVLYKDLPYDTLHDLAGVAPLASLPSVLVVPTSLGVHTVKELVALAKAKAGELNYATAGGRAKEHRRGKGGGEEGEKGGGVGEAGGGADVNEAGRVRPLHPPRA